MRVIVFDSSKDVDYLNELKIASGLLCESVNTLFVDINHLSITFLESEKIELLIGNELSIDWLYILNGMGIVSIIFGPLQIYSSIADIVIDYKHSEPSYHFSGIEFKMSNANFDFPAVTRIIDILEWDSDFFDFPIAIINTRHLTNNIQRFIDRFVSCKNVELIQYLSNCHDNRSVIIAERNNYHFTDIRLTFALNLRTFNSNCISNNTSGILALANPSHLKTLVPFTKNMYKDSRYFFDGNFNLDKINKFYAEWIEKSIYGKFDNECLIYLVDNSPIAFCTLRFNHDIAHIGLFGVSSSFINRGLGKEFLSEIILELRKRNLNYVHVVTQGRNYPAQRLYQSVGFKTLKTELWYHKWR